MESPALFEPIANVCELPLPSAEADFDAGVACSPLATLENGKPGASVYAELVRGLKLWSTIFSLVKIPESSTGDRFIKIYALDDALMGWWSSLQADYKLDPATLQDMPIHQLSGTLLVNVLYHQSMCALHASVVPLFSWTSSDDSWGSARQASAQKTYEHAGAISDLIAAITAAHPKLTMTHSFLAYAAYSGCAVQLPFTWSSNPAIKKRAATNQKQFSCLYRIHEKRAVDLEDEPKNIDVGKLVGFKINATDARISILGFTEILRSKDQGYASPGEENNNLGIQEHATQNPSENMEVALTDRGTGNEIAPNPNINEAMDIGDRQTSFSMASADLHSAEPFPLTSNNDPHSYQTQPQVPSSDLSSEPGPFGIEQQLYNLWPPFFHPTMLDVPLDSEIFNLPQGDMGSIDLHGFQPEDWFMSTNP
ncbi:hypothetical protein LTR70_010144 [Exophiala xenobiotica]|uniref:Mating-type protein MAT-1 n=1 Tax=Lithohypha guttulata TaxID=1690604 RepID=A0ABR0JV91_9EURO|nr:hypothetical protein LTR24_010101 [Lithohypha guttulata]KAK5309603.1 hypothetical protein LTR70_010144 [Exophiala xenobiotica]